jgi:hypothetical protein
MEHIFTIIAIIGTVGLGLLAMYEHGSHKEWMRKAEEQEKQLDAFIEEHGLNVEKYNVR